MISQKKSEFITIRAEYLPYFFNCDSFFFFNIWDGKFEIKAFKREKKTIRLCYINIDKYQPFSIFVAKVIRDKKRDESFDRF